MLSVDRKIAVDPVATVDPVALEKSISSATEALLGYRQSDGHFVFELEADSTIPSEYILLRHYLAEPVDAELEAKIANYLRRTQGNHGGWPLVHDGPFDMSASVKSYFALKMIGDSVDAPHMVRAREAIRSRGGAARVNVFTRFLLAFYGVLPWRAVPVLPVEIVLLPMWSPFHLNKISYWARTTIVPLMVMAALKPLAIGEHEAYCQPCASPVWNTALTCHALAEAGGEDTLAKMKQGLDWLKPRQVLDLKGDWAAKAPDVRPGGWAFQYNNDYYPDLDDTAVVVMAMDRVRRQTGSNEYDAAIARGREWIEGLQSRDGGWAAFDVNNLEYYLNNIPFSDHGALLDPPTEDVTARCISMLAQLGETAETSTTVADGIAYLRRTQLAEGSWYGRWGLNYVYGTWSVLSALNAAGVDHQDPMMRKAVDWLVSIQNKDGGWGENAVSYRLDYKGFEDAPSTSSQTAWALLGLMAAGEVESPAVVRGVEYLKTTQTEKGLWDEARHTATGFPRVFYLRYHGYSKFFPLWALARYRNLRSTNSKVVGGGM